MNRQETIHDNLQIPAAHSTQTWAMLGLSFSYHLPWTQASPSLVRAESSQWKNIVPQLLIYRFLTLDIIPGKILILGKLSPCATQKVLVVSLDVCRELESAIKIAVQVNSNKQSKSDYYHHYYHHDAFKSWENKTNQKLVAGKHSYPDSLVLDQLKVNYI